LFALAGDILIGYAAPGAVGKYGLVQSGWSEVAIWRPTLSMILASISFPLYLPGIYAVSMRIGETVPKAGKAFLITACAASTGGLMIHATFCFPQFAYKYLCDAGYPDLAVRMTNSMLDMAMPSVLFASASLLTGFLILSVVILQKKTMYSWWTVLLSPIIIFPAVVFVAYVFSDSAYFAAFGMCKINLGFFLFFLAVAVQERKHLLYSDIR